MVWTGTEKDEILQPYCGSWILWITSAAVQQGFDSERKTSSCGSASDISLVYLDLDPRQPALYVAGYCAAAEDQ